MAARQIAKPEIVNANPNKMFYVISNGFEHPPNLPIDPLPQHNAQTHR
jgi:hypothetical protein